MRIFLFLFFKKGQVHSFNRLVAGDQLSVLDMFTLATEFAHWPKTFSTDLQNGGKELSVLRRLDVSSRLVGSLFYLCVFLKKFFVFS